MDIFYSSKNYEVFEILFYIKKSTYIGEHIAKLKSVVSNHSKMSHRANSSLNDTIPLEKGTTNLSSSNQTYYGSDYSTPSSGNSKNSSVQILHEVINLTTSSDSDQGGKPNQVTLRFNK